MAWRGAVCRLFVNPQRCAIISASRAQGTAAPARWGECHDTVPATEITLFKETVHHPQMHLSTQMVSLSFADYTQTHPPIWRLMVAFN